MRADEFADIFRSMTARWGFRRDEVLEEWYRDFQRFSVEDFNRALEYVSQTFVPDRYISWPSPGHFFRALEREQAPSQPESNPDAEIFADLWRVVQNLPKEQRGKLERQAKADLAGICPGVDWANALVMARMVMIYREQLQKGGEAQ